MVAIHRKFPMVLTRAITLFGLGVSPALSAEQAVASTKDSLVVLDRIEVVGHVRNLSQFPGAITVIDGDRLRDGQRQVNLSESLSRVPGVSVLDRQNYAQDLQIQSRGFGARSTFGIRGIKLVVDGIPSGAADGQGQTGTFPLGALDRIEVLRGPLALQYGNAAGGAIVGYTDLDAPNGVAVDAWLGGDDSARAALRLDGGRADGAWRWRMQGSHFQTDGARPHSAAERAQLGIVGEWSSHEDQRVRFVLNSLTQPETQDPLGLTRASLRSDPRGTDPAAQQFDTRKRIDHHQAGLRWERDFTRTCSAWFGAYRVERDVVQFLALPVAAQSAPGSAGGVIDLSRSSTGIDAGHRWSWAHGALAIGIEAGQLFEARRGYENFVGDRLGVRGRLRRDECNRVDNRELYAIADIAPAPDWTLLAAVRHTRLDFSSDDRYIGAGNGDDSGRIAYRETAASLGIARAFERGEVFASIGRGFETPTVTELAYRPDGVAGFNRALVPARVASTELGMRWRVAGQDANLAIYRIEGDDDIVPADSRGGRASFANAGRTRREGIEAGITGAFAEQWSYALSASWLRAGFVETFDYRVSVGGQSAVRTVAAGNRIPGVPRADAYAELAWRSNDRRWVVAVETRASDRIAVDDRNSDFAAGNARFALRLQWRAREGSGWHGFLRIENVFDREYVGSVIVNESNGRFFEPGAGRALTLGFGWSGAH